MGIYRNDPSIRRQAKIAKSHTVSDGVFFLAHLDSMVDRILNRAAFKRSGTHRRLKPKMGRLVKPWPLKSDCRLYGDFSEVGYPVSRLPVDAAGKIRAIGDRMRGVVNRFCFSAPPIVLPSASSCSDFQGIWPPAAIRIFEI